MALAYPVVISQLGHVLVSLADSLMVGHLGSVSLAACSLSISIFSSFMVLGIGIAYGITPLVAQEDGAGRPEECAAIYKNGLFINLLIGIALAGIIYGITPLLTILKQDPDVLREAIPFLDIIAISMIPFMIFLSFKQFAEGLAFTKQAMIISIGANVLNIFLNYVLINGYWGFPKMGLNGAGIANLTARTAMAIAMAWYVFRAKRFQPYLQIARGISISKEYVVRILKIGIPTGMQYIFEVSAFSGAAIIIGQMGAEQLAAHQIALSMAAVSYMMASGLSAAASVRVGNAFGRKDFADLRLSGFVAYHLVVIFMFCSALVFLAFRFWLPSLYVSDTQVIGIAASLLFIAALFQLSDGVQVIGLGVLRGLGDVRIPTIVTLTAYWIIGLPVGYWLGTGLEWGVEGVWYGLLIGLSITAVLLLLRFHYLSRKLKQENYAQIPL